MTDVPPWIGRHEVEEGLQIGAAHVVEDVGDLLTLARPLADRRGDGAARELLDGADVVEHGLPEGRALHDLRVVQELAQRPEALAVLGAQVDVHAGDSKERARFERARDVDPVVQRGALGDGPSLHAELHAGLRRLKLQDGAAGQ